jgi:hypothetical protein
VAHPTSRRSRNTSDEANHGLVGCVVLLQEIGSIFLGRTTDLTNHDDTVRLLVLQEDLQAVDEVGPGERVTSNADNEGLSEASLGSLVDGFIGQSTGAGDDTDATALVNEAWHNANLALALETVSLTTPEGQLPTYRSNDSGAVGSNHPGLVL